MSRNNLRLIPITLNTSVLKIPFKPISATIMFSKSSQSKFISLKNSMKIWKNVTFYSSPWIEVLICDFYYGRDDWSAMAVSLSTNAVKLYSPVVGQYYGECKGHSATINQILFSSPSNPHVLSSCSSDGTIRAWDTRIFQQVYFMCCICYYKLFFHKLLFSYNL